MRLTRKTDETSDYDKYVYGDYIKLNEPLHSIVTKLGELEDIEERIGASLIELLKEPYCTIFIKKHHDRYGDKVNVYTIQEHTLYSIVPQEKCIYVTFENIKFYWKDYGKTWALTKEELL